MRVDFIRCGKKHIIMAAKTKINVSEQVVVIHEKMSSHFFGSTSSSSSSYSLPMLLLLLLLTPGEVCHLCQTELSLPLSAKTFNPPSPFDVAPNAKLSYLS
jgi:hypothetical protein